MGVNFLNILSHTLAPALLIFSAGANANGTLYGFTPFPYDMTAEAVSRTYEIVNKFGTIYAIQLDDGIPWREALENKPWPFEVQQHWEEFKQHQPTGRKIVVSVAPLDEDRRSRAPAAKGSSIPPSLWLAGLDSNEMKTAYLNYITRVVTFFRPDYLNIGQEAGELAFHNPQDWQRFVELYQHVRTAIKKISPNTAIGISFNLQMLMDKKVAQRCEQLIQASDFIGISFYPYMSPAYQRYGLDPLPPVPGLWQKPLDWLGKFSKKPIAIFETGYTSTDIVISKDGLTLHGNTDEQSQYLRGLLEFAKRDNYLFVIWFMPIDYEKLLTRLKLDNEYYKIWQYVGFFDSNNQAKPAWNIWQELVNNHADASISTTVAQANASIAKNSGDPASISFPSVLKIGFNRVDELFQADADNHFVLEPKAYQQSAAMRWSFEYASGRWQWGVRPLETPLSSSQNTMQITIRSDREGPIIIQLTEEGGEAFFTTILVGKTWRTIRLSLRNFAVDPAKAQDKQLTIERIRQILIADPGATSDNPAKGSRIIWLADWEFYAQ